MNGLVARAFVQALATAGVRHAVVCPGSRSTPLALALAAEPRIRVWMHVDERSAAFFGLGLARASRSAVAVACSSGTAAANFLPAVVEGTLGRVPLVLLTADRPPELRDLGAPQTIDQVRLYGTHAKWFAELPLPETHDDIVAHARTVAARAVATAIAAPAGAVHVNLPFREPLIDALPLPPDNEGVRVVAVDAGVTALSPAAVADYAQTFAREPRGAIVCGPLADPAFATAVSALARRLGWPIFADPLSGVRCGPHDRDLVIDGYDVFLREPAVAQRFTPAVVLRYGALPTSKVLWQHLGGLRGCRHIVVDDGGWTDPMSSATGVVHADPVRFCRDLTAALPSPSPRDATWAAQWTAVSQRTRAALATLLDGDDAFFEGRIFAELGTLAPSGATLFAGNSMPVRDLDTFFGGRDEPLALAANRGANGIDGVVSTALGYAAASDAPVILALGDLSFYHDSNGLLAAKLHALRATIVVIDNDGGGIFSFLPQARAIAPPLFEQLFGTPTGLDAARFAAVYECAYAAPMDWDEFRAAVNDGMRRAGCSIVHVRTVRAVNVERHRAIVDGVRDALRATPADATR